MTAEMGLSCASCGEGEGEVATFVVTTLDYSDIKHTRTEVCLPCWILENRPTHCLCCGDRIEFVGPAAGDYVHTEVPE